MEALNYYGGGMRATCHCRSSFAHSILPHRKAPAPKIASKAGIGRNTAF